VDGSHLRDNPWAVPGAADPAIRSVPVNGTALYAEIRGDGPTVLIVPGGAEDAEGWRPVAERLGGLRVVTYDRRGTLRSGREDWPGRGAIQHADDAAGLLESLGAASAVVFGGSSGGIVAIELALRHPGLVRRALAFEPGYLRSVPAGEAAHAAAAAAVDARLATDPGDWVGAYAAFARAVSSGPPDAGRGFLEPPPGKEWYAHREELDAESLMRDDIPILTAGLVDEAALAASPVDIRISHGTATLPVFREIATRLASLRGAKPDVLEGVGHSLYLHPEAAAAYIARRLES
jgi:pimeloyl-ACP methyl ester carboxylesterase